MLAESKKEWNPEIMSGTRDYCEWGTTTLTQNALSLHMSIFLASSWIILTFIVVHGPGLELHSCLFVSNNTSLRSPLADFFPFLSEQLCGSYVPLVRPVARVSEDAHCNEVAARI